MWFLFFSLLILWITLIDFWMLVQACILRINITWSWYTIFFVHFWIWFANISLRTYASILIKVTGLEFSLISLYGFVIRIIIAQKIVRKYSLRSSGRKFGSWDNFFFKHFVKLTQWTHLGMVLSLLEDYYFLLNFFKIYSLSSSMQAAITKIL